MENKNLKKELVRVVKTSEGGEVKMDITGKINGRGAYICPTIECLDNAIKGKKISRSLETEISDEVYRSLKDVLMEEIGKKENTFK